MALPQELEQQQKILDDLQRERSPAEVELLARHAGEQTRLAARHHNERAQLLKSQQAEQQALRQQQEAAKQEAGTAS
jgi:hypothetical protein